MPQRVRWVSSDVLACKVSCCTVAQLRSRLITGGEDALYIARRLVVVASEDVGLADNHALPLAMATYQACQTIGLPECRINLAVRDS